MHQIKAAIRRLPATAKAVVTLAVIEGFSYQEISEIEGLRLGTVKSRLHRARKQLRRKLGRLAELRGYESGCTLQRQKLKVS
jgi:RNA polymerase sigma-70 factor (ECF subfamily)